MLLIIDNYDSFTYNLVQAFGSFGADMKIDLCNDGPVTIVIDSRNRS